MNRLKIVFFAFSFYAFLSLQSCHDSVEISVTRVIKNNSIHQVILEGYLGVSNDIERMTINPGDSILEREVCIFEDVGGIICTVSQLPYDSLKIIYGEERSELFCSGLYPACINLEKDIMSFNPFAENGESTGGYVEAPENTFTYTITNEDYDRAEPIVD